LSIRDWIALISMKKVTHHARLQAAPKKAEERSAAVKTGDKRKSIVLLKRSLIESRRCAEHLTAIVRAAMDAIICVDRDQRITGFNPAAEAMFGVRAAKMQGQRLDGLFPTPRRSGRTTKVRAGVARGLTGARTNDVQLLTAKRSDGREFPVEAVVTQSGRAQQRVTTVILRDVSQRLREVEGFLENEKVLLDFFTAAPLGLMWVREDGRVERVNESQLEIMGRPSREVVDFPLAKFHDDPAVIGDVLEKVAKRKTVRNCHARVVRKDGSIRHVLVDANGLWKSGRLGYSRWFVRDITRRRDLEREILAIAERERERIGQELHDDLCQQLTAIEYMSETAATALELVQPESAQAVHEISQSLRHAIDHARELARGLSPPAVMGNGGLSVALQDLAERTGKIFQRDCRFHCAKPVLMEDQSTGIHLFRIAQEAVGNAIKHGKATRIDIQLTVLGNDLVLGVHDNGCGLSEQPATGRGMGLRIMQYRAGAINGSIVVQRENSGGTAVVCTVKGALRLAIDGSFRA
jgi:two-component system sensor kinase FixL